MLAIATKPDTIRIAGLAGVAGIALGVAGVFVDRMETFPGTGASAAEVADFVAANRTALLVAMLLNTTAITLWLAFGAGVWVWLRWLTGGEGVLSACFLFGFIAFVTLLFAGFTAFFLLVYRGGGVSDPRLLYDLAFGLLAMSGAPTALALGSYAALALRTQYLPAWTAYLALPGAVTHVGLLASFVVGSGFFSLEGGVIIAIPATLFAWIGATGIVMASTDWAAYGGSSSARNVDRIPQ